MTTTPQAALLSEAAKADKIGNRGAATYFRARATKFLRVANRAALKAGM